MFRGGRKEKRKVRLVASLPLAEAHIILYVVEKGKRGKKRRGGSHGRRAP